MAGDSFTVNITVTATAEATHPDPDTMTPEERRHLGLESE